MSMPIPAARGHGCGPWSSCPAWLASPSLGRRHEGRVRVEAQRGLQRGVRRAPLERGLVVQPLHARHRRQLPPRSPPGRLPGCHWRAASASASPSWRPDSPRSPRHASAAARVHPRSLPGPRPCPARHRGYSSRERVESREKSRARCAVERDESSTRFRSAAGFFSIFYFHQLKSAPLETA